MPAFTRMIYHKSVISNNEFNKLRSGEDQCFLRDLNFLNYKYFVSTELIYTYITTNVGQLTQNSDSLLDSQKTLDYLVDGFANVEDQMKDFAFAQIMKIFLGVIRNMINSNFGALFSRRTFKWLNILIRRPILSVRSALYFASHRIRLAGRN